VTAIATTAKMNGKLSPSFFLLRHAGSAKNYLEKLHNLR